MELSEACTLSSIAAAMEDTSLSDAGISFFDLDTSTTDLSNASFSEYFLKNDFSVNCIEDLQIPQAREQFVSDIKEFLFKASSKSDDNAADEIYCPTCKTRFDVKLYVDTHFQNPHISEACQCPFCEQNDKFSSVDSFLFHFKKHFIFIDMELNNFYNSVHNNIFSSEDSFNENVLPEINNPEPILDRDAIVTEADKNQVIQYIKMRMNKNDIPSQNYLNLRATIHCATCEKDYTIDDYFYCHCQTHNEFVICACPLCVDVRYVKYPITSFLHHLQRHFVEGIEVRKMRHCCFKGCEATFFNRLQLRAHSKNIHPKKPEPVLVEADVENYKRVIELNNHLSVFQTHVAAYSGEGLKPFAVHCGMCKLDILANIYPKHFEVCKNMNEFVCSFCKKKHDFLLSSVDKIVETHLNFYYRGLKETCPSCNIVFATRHNYALHTTNIHSSPQDPNVVVKKQKLDQNDDICNFDFYDFNDQGCSSDTNFISIHMGFEVDL